MPERLPDHLTPATPSEVFAALRRAWEAQFGHAPQRTSLLVLLAQWALETGRGHAMHCYNLGNAKHVPNDGRDWTFFACNEVIAEHIKWFYPDDPACCFRAFKTLDEGAADYLSLISRARFAFAWPAVLAGDPGEFSHALKAKGYYTADESQYTRSLQSLFLEFSRTVGNALDLHSVRGQQAALNALGAQPPLAVDGRFGPKTAAAVRWFQVHHGLEADGVADSKTVQALAVAYSVLAL